MTAIAIVGAGASGVMAACRLRQELGPAAELTVFEREAWVGGRHHRLDFAGTTVEVGPVTWPTSGAWLASLLRLADLEPRRHGRPAGATDTLGFWNGSRFTLTTEATPAALRLGLARRYGVASLLRVVTLTRRTTRRWHRLYGWQRDGRLFATPDELLGALDLTAVAGRSLRHVLARQGLKGDFIDDVLGAWMRQRHNLDAGLDALAGAVGLAEAGLVGRAWAGPAEGQQAVFERAWAALDVELVTGTRVSQIAAADPAWRPAGVPERRGRPTRGRDDRDDPSIRPSAPVRLTAGRRRRDFAAVVVTAPLDPASLKLSAAGQPLTVPTPPSTSLYVTLVAGRPDPAYFRLPPGQSVPSQVVTANSPTTPFTSLRRVGHSPTFDQDIWRLQSVGRPLAEVTLKSLFVTHDSSRRLVWKTVCAVPTPAAPRAPFVLAPGLYATGGLGFAEAVELSAAAGYNAAGWVLRQVAS